MTEMGEPMELKDTPLKTTLVSKLHTHHDRFFLHKAAPWPRVLRVGCVALCPPERTHRTPIRHCGLLPARVAEPEQRIAHRRGIVARR